MFTNIEAPVRESGIQRCIVEDYAVTVLVRACVHACAGGSAGCGRCITLRKERAFLSQRVQIGCLHTMSQHREAFGSPLIGGDEENVLGQTVVGIKNWFRVERSLLVTNRPVKR